MDQVDHPLFRQVAVLQDDPASGACRLENGLLRHGTLTLAQRQGHDGAGRQLRLRGSEGVDGRERVGPGAEQQNQGLVPVRVLEQISNLRSL